MPVTSDVVVTFFSSIIVLITNDNYLIVPLLHSVSELFHVYNPNEKFDCFVMC